jgi:uncharacterized membrane protein
VLRGKALKKARNQEMGRALVGRTVTIGKPAQELYAFWRKFDRFPEFMDNVREIRRIDEARSEWIFERRRARRCRSRPASSRMLPARTIASVSEPDSQIEHERPGGVRRRASGPRHLCPPALRYTPPAGELGRLVAKVMQREPNVQARRDLRRFKQLMETGEIPVNASPSARKSESPTQPRI